MHSYGAFLEYFVAAGENRDSLLLCMELLLSLGLCLVSFLAQVEKQLCLVQNAGAFSFRDLGVSIPTVLSLGWVVKY